MKIQQLIFLTTLFLSLLFNFVSHSEAKTITVSYSPYFANPFGAEDATDEIQEAIDDSIPGDTILLGNGIYKISRTLNLRDDRTLLAYYSSSGKGTLNWAGPVGGTMLSVGKNSKVQYVTFDGKFSARICITMPQNNRNVWIHGIIIKSLRATSTASAYGILVPNGCGTVTQPILLTGSVSNPLVISDINGGANGKVGDSIGANRGILMSNSHVSISKCMVEKIGPSEDGDAIHAQAVGLTVNVSIDYCKISEFEKRGIKIQANGVKVTNNIISTSKANAYAGIEVIASSSALIQKNSVSTPANVVLTHGISINGNNSTVKENIIDIAGNVTSTPFGVVNALMLNSANYNNVIANQIRNAPFNGIRILNSSFNMVTGNVINTDNPSRRVIIEGTSRQNTISN